MNLKTIYKQILERLNKFSTEPETEANLIINKLFNTSKLDLLLNKEIEPDTDKLSYLENILQQREQRVPLQYIFNEQKFRDYTFYVDSRVLIPRPETELLVDQVIEIAKNFPDGQKIVDIGTGSGAIAISLAIELEKAIVYSVDISEEALKVAEINKEKYNLENQKLILIHGDKLETFRSEKIKFEILVSNPPYIPKELYLNLEKEVIENEPRLALIGTDKDGLGFYRYFAREAKNFIKPGGFLCFEIGYGQARTITDILVSEEKFDKIDIIKDYNNIERIVIARFNYENITG
jgi:release factor glutamine methyltransferase